MPHGSPVGLVQTAQSSVPAATFAIGALPRTSTALFSKNSQSELPAASGGNGDMEAAHSHDGDVVMSSAYEPVAKPPVKRALFPDAITAVAVTPKDGSMSESNPSPVTTTSSKMEVDDSNEGRPARQEVAREDIEAIESVLRPRYREEDDDSEDDDPHKFRQGRARVELPDELSDEQKELAKKRMEDMQKKFQEAMARAQKQKLTEVINAAEAIGPQYRISEREAKLLLDVCNDDELDTIDKIVNTGGKIIDTVREMAGINPEKEREKQERSLRRATSSHAFRSTEPGQQPTVVNRDRMLNMDDGSATESDGDDDGDSPRRKRKASRKRKPSSTEFGSDSPKRSRVVTAPRLRLDEALENTEDMDGWSEARKKAYKLIDVNPNAYYYRFNAPGQKQRNGKWTKEEAELFLKRMEEIGVDGRWGIFSIPIPGRVGYQCSNYYRSQVKDGNIVDPNYFVDEEGKLKYNFKSRQSSSDSPKVVRTPRSPKPKKEKPKKEPKPPKSPKARSSSSEDRAAPARKPAVDPNANNPIPDVIDPITLNPIVQPALSPYGHVVGYDTWCKLLREDPKNTCPFTKLPLTRRDLVKLTKANLKNTKRRL